MYTDGAGENRRGITGQQATLPGSGTDSVTFLQIIFKTEPGTKLKDSKAIRKRRKQKWMHSSLPLERS